MFHNINVVVEIVITYNNIMKGDDIMTILIINIMFCLIVVLTCINTINAFTVSIQKRNWSTTFYMYCVRGP